MHPAFCCWTFIFMTIGVCAYFLGCNHNYDSQCYGYDVVQGTAYGYKFTSETCKECVSSGKGGCYKWRKYPCFSAYVKFHYDNNQTCNFAASFESKSESQAHNSMKSYPVGDKMTLLEREGSSSNCLKASAGMDAWITGVTFLTLTVLLMFGWMAYAIIPIAQEYFLKHYNPVPVTAEVEMVRV